MKRFSVREWLLYPAQKNVRKGFADGLGLPVTGMYSHRRFLLGCIIASLGIFISATGGSWDISNHLLNKPETFFSAPHAMLYTGVGSAMVGCIVMFRAYKSMHTSCHLIGTSAKLVIVGISMLITAGPVDFGWHSAFGLDGLLSPPHFVLLMGMIISSPGSLLGIIILCTNCNNKLHNDNNNNAAASNLENVSVYKQPSSVSSGTSILVRTSYIAIILIIMGLMPVWMSLDGMISMFSLPFSKTQYFNFNPDPSYAAVFATVGYPFLLSLILISCFRLGENRFGVVSIAGSIYLAVTAITAIIPNESLISTLPFYIMNLVPLIAVDILLSVFQHRYLFSISIGGAILGSTFFMVQYPLITYVYNEVVTKQAFVWPSLTSSVYFGMIGNIYPLLVIPGIAMGIIGAITANRILSVILSSIITHIPKNFITQEQSSSSFYTDRN
ncbi:MAG TPA: hypothetical protein VE223_05665 [Nitrososphaeraceae archaeon]|nr:hypothetical protein [Nitrososphaeraceae archaeon]